MQVQITGLDELRRNLSEFSDRRFAAAVATALTRTARVVQTAWQAELREKVDRPTPLTERAPIVEQATAQSLTAIVRMRDQVAAGQPPSLYLQPPTFGGGRQLKQFEKALIAQGSMPSGTFAVPTDYAKRDAYGNVTRGQLVQILVQLAGGSVSGGYRRVISASAQRRAQAAIRAGKEYVAVLQREGKLRPGIYGREGNKLRMVFSYESRVTYRRMLSLADRAKTAVDASLQDELRRAVEESAARLAAKTRG